MLCVTGCSHGVQGGKTWTGKRCGAACCAANGATGRVCQHAHSARGRAPPDRVDQVYHRWRHSVDHPIQLQRHWCGHAPQLYAAALCGSMQASHTALSKQSSRGQRYSAEHRATLHSGMLLCCCAEVAQHATREALEVCHDLARRLGSAHAPSEVVHATSRLQSLLQPNATAAADPHAEADNDHSLPLFLLQGGGTADLAEQSNAPLAVVSAAPEDKMAGCCCRGLMPDRFAKCTKPGVYSSAYCLASGKVRPPRHLLVTCLHFTQTAPRSLAPASCVWWL